MERHHGTARNDARQTYSQRSRLTRSKLLPPPENVAASSGLAAGAGVLGGFSTIWAQNIKDVVLHHAGTPVAAIPAIADQASKDLGITVAMQATENADLLNRFLSQSSAIDCADVSITFMKYLVGRGILQTIPISKVKHWDDTIPLLTPGTYPDGREAPKQGVAVRPVVAFSLKMRGVAKAERHKRAREVLMLVHMEAYAERLP